MRVSLLVEGRLDAAVARRIITSTGGRVGKTYGRKGVGYIRTKIDGFNQMAQGVRMLTLVDLMDTPFACPVKAVDDWLPYRNEQMLLRFVVREIESWLPADRTGIAQYLGVRKSEVPYNPEDLDDPKKSLVDVARSSRFASLKQDIVPDDPTTNDQGPAYTSRMRRFVRERWDLDAAMRNASSLHRCVRAVRDLVEDTSS
jgi:hypothetical protein